MRKGLEIYEWVLFENINCKVTVIWAVRFKPPLNVDVVVRMVVVRNLRKRNKENKCSYFPDSAD